MGKSGIRGRVGQVEAAGALAIAAVVATTEWLAGRALICRCGWVSLWTGKVDGPENSQQFADWYSLSHLVHGLLFYAATHLIVPRLRIGHRFVLAVAIEAAWEVLENSPWIIDRYRSATMALGYTGDSILNSLGDIAFMALGFAIAARVPAWMSVAIALSCELLALAAIRDNLTLNIVMLVHPFAAIRAWQVG